MERGIPKPKKLEAQPGTCREREAVSGDSNGEDLKTCKRAFGPGEL